MRYFDRQKACDMLTKRRAIEQWFGYRVEGEERVLSWLRIVPESDGRCEVSVYEVYDQGDLEYTDIVNFQGFDPENPYGVACEYSSPKAALEASIGMGASPDRFVGSGMVELEYRRFLEAHDVWRYGPGED